MFSHKRSGVILVIALMLFTLSQSGCAWRRARTNIADMYERVGRVQEGSTTDAELVQILGSPPNNILELPGNKFVYLYTFGDSKTEAFSLILFEVSRNNIGVDSALFIVEDGVVQKMHVSTNSKDLAWQFWAWGD